MKTDTPYRISIDGILFYAHCYITNIETKDNFLKITIRTSTNKNAFLWIGNNKSVLISEYEE